MVLAPSSMPIQIIFLTGALWSQQFGTASSTDSGTIRFGISERKKIFGEKKKFASLFKGNFLIHIYSGFLEEMLFLVLGHGAIYMAFKISKYFMNWVG